MTEIAIILPAYNEELTIAKTIEAFYRAMPDARIIVVNNNSVDKTRSVALNTFSRLEARGEIIDEFRQGKGFAMRRAFSDVDADVYVMCDADETYPADKVGELIQPVLDGRADMVVGDRHSLGFYQAENKRRFHSFGNDLVTFLINKLFKAELKDIMSGYRAYSKSFVKNYPILISGFELETDMSLHALDKRFRILELPILYQDRPEGSESKLNTLKDGAKVIFAILQLLRYYRPMVFFGFLSGLFMLLSLGCGVPVIKDWITYQYIYHVPLAVLASALAIVSFVTFGVGLLLDAINHQNRMRFEQSIMSSESIKHG